MLVALFVLSRTKYQGPILRKIYGTARVMAYGMVVCGGVGLYTAHNAAADFREQGLKVGADLQELTDLMGETEEIRINNQSIYMSTATSDETVSQVLDRFQANCDSHPGAMKDLLKEVVEKRTPTKEFEKKDTKTLTTQREEAHDQGTVICMAGQEGKLGWKDAITAFTNTGDLSNIGNLRYVYAQKDPKSGTTSIRTVWTEGKFNFYAVMPKDGELKVDAPGSDANNVPRPEHTMRIFTAEAANNQYAARFYQTDDAPKDQLAAYDSKMEKLGWEMVTVDQVGTDADTTHWYMNHDSGEQMVFQAGHDDHANKTMVIVATVGKLENAPVAKAAAL